MERYIPPASPSEDEATFSPHSSILYDRLFELSPQGGSILIIYPTKAGAKNFLRKYLGPVLDPILRRLMVLHALPTNLLLGIEKMTAVDGMLEFEQLHERIKGVCNQVNAAAAELLDGDAGPGPNSDSSDSSFAEGSSIRLVHSSRQQAPLNQYDWAEWWSQQESNRIRELIRRHSYSIPAADGVPFTMNLPTTFPSTSVSSVPLSESRTTSVSSVSGIPVPPRILAPLDTTSVISSPSQVMSFQSIGPGDLAREIMEGVRSGVASGKNRMGSDGEDTGVEVGVFVLRREG
jgi:hypothetical protein